MIIEENYDSEFRYRGRPLPALDGLGCTIYLGRFSKVFSPAMRFDNLFLPLAQVQAAKDRVLQVGARASLIPQPALATFMQSGDFHIHLRRMRRIYARR